MFDKIIFLKKKLQLLHLRRITFIPLHAYLFECLSEQVISIIFLYFSFLKKTARLMFVDVDAFFWNRNKYKYIEQVQV